MHTQISDLIEKELRPEGGWWKSDSADDVKRCAQKLLDGKELTVDEVYDICSSLIAVGRSEYGE